MCHKLDPVFFSRLAALDPDDVCRRTACGYDRDSKTYTVPFLRWKYRIDPARGEIFPLASDAREVSADMGVVVLFYLLQAKDIAPAGVWVSEFDLPGGAMFFRGPHRFRTDELAGRFGRDLDGFRAACLALDGEPLAMGDAAYRFQVLPRVPAAAVLWSADDEFDASAKLLMDSTISLHLPLDVIFGMALELLGALVGRSLWA